MKEIIKVKLAESIKLSFHYPPALFSSPCGFPPFFVRLWLERIFLGWKGIISKYRVLKKNLKMNVSSQLDAEKKETPVEVYSDS